MSSNVEREVSVPFSVAPAVGVTAAFLHIPAALLYSCTALLHSGAVIILHTTASSSRSGDREFKDSCRDQKENHKTETRPKRGVPRGDR